MCAKVISAISVAVLFLCFCQFAFDVQESQAQSSGPSGRPAVPANPPAPLPDESRQVFNSPPRDGLGTIAIQRILTRLEFWLSSVVLLFGFVVVIVQYRLLRLRSFTSDEVLRVFTVTLIIVGTLFALTAGFDSQQIAPAMGLFGTIAGYLLGRRSPERQPQARTSDRGSAS